LCETIESWLAQSLGDFELVIYDNASTDQTPMIAERFAQRDPRVRLVRHPRDLGALANLILAAEQARTPYFCWAAHDDLREPAFLQALIRLLQEHPEAGLACCAVRNIDPDGARRTVRPETDSLRTTDGMTSVARLLMYLKQAPGTPFYGLFRTSALHESLWVLREAAGAGGAPMLGLDMAFLADVVRRHQVAIANEPLLLFRRGGYSHRLDVYGSLGGLLAQMRRFAGSLRSATTQADQTAWERLRLRAARYGYLVRFFMSQPMRRMTLHYVRAAMPVLRWLSAHWSARRHPAFARLRCRARQLPRGSRVVLFGAGKHTRRCFDAIRIALGRQASIVAIVDDAADRCAVIGGIQPIHALLLRSVRADVVLISSDAYEETLCRRAKSNAPITAPIWCIYDRTLEAIPDERSMRSTDEVNSSISSSASVCVGSTIGSEGHELIASMNEIRC